MSFKRLIRKNNGNERIASIDIKTMPSVAKTSDFHLALSDYVYNELRKNKHKVKKMNDLTVHLALEKTTEQNYDSIIIDCLDGKIYLRGIEQRDRQIGRLRNFKGDRASDAYHCMKSSIQKILSRIEKYRTSITDYRQ